MTKNLDQLRQVAERATPGPWAVYDRGIGYEVHDANGYELNGGMRETFTEADAIHIATFDPPTVVGLIDRVEAAEREAKAAKGALTQSIAERALDTHHAAGIAADEAVKGVVKLIVDDPDRRAREAESRAEAAEAAVQRVQELAEKWISRVQGPVQWVQLLDMHDELTRAMDGGEQK